MDMYQRRRFLQHMGQAALFLPGLNLLSLEEVVAGTALPHTDPETGLQRQDGKKLGVALVGLGQYSSEQLAPALKETQRCRLAGIVTGTREKADKWKQRYSIPDKNVYNYENFDEIRNNPDIDMVYVVLPNALHAEFTIRAAKAGKHVICEKPMAVTVEECEAMIKACKDANRMLSIGYRLHFEPHHQTFMEFANKKTYGPIKKVIADDGQKMEPNVWRLEKKLAGGGPLMDVGIYCVQAALYSTGELPTAVTAKEGPKTDLERFKEVEESMTWQLQFPSGAVAECRTSYNADMNRLRVEAQKGWYELDPAYPYSGIKGKTIQGDLGLKNVSQQARQMDDFADCIINKKKTRVPGEMGLRDVKILMATYEAARTGKKVPLTW